MRRGILLLLLLLFAVASKAHAQTEWRLPSGYPESNFHTENIRQFAAEVEHSSGGALKIVVYSDGTLFKANEIKRAVQVGQVPIGEVIISAFSAEAPIFGIDSIPFLATSYADAEKLWQATRPATEAYLAEQGLKVLYAVPWPPQGIFSLKPIASTADLSGARWRAYNAASRLLARLVGAQPVTIQAADLTHALSSGLIDVFMSSGATGYDTRVWEHMRHYYDVRGWIPKNLVIVNQKAFDALDMKSREALTRSAAAAEARGWKLSEQKNAWHLEQLKMHGMSVASPSPSLQAGLKALGETMIDEWLRLAGPEARNALAAYRKHR